MAKVVWFKTKKYGYGWYPLTSQGWLILTLFVVGAVLNFYRIDSGSYPASDTLINAVPQTILLAIALILICRATGEPARWRWGDDEKSGGINQK